MTDNACPLYQTPTNLTCVRVSGYFVQNFGLTLA